MPTARGEVSAAVGERERECEAPPCEVVAVVGGYSFPARTEARVDGYLPEEGRWVRLPDLPEARHHPAAAGLDDGTIVVSGGAPSATDERPTSQVWALAPDADDWTAIQDLPEPRWGHRMVGVDDRLVAVGGHGGETTFVWSETDGWSAAAPIAKELDHLGAVEIEGEIWTIGGRHELEFTSRVAIYNPEQDAWRDGPDLPEPVSAAGVGVVDNALVVVSGEEYGLLTGGILTDSWMYDLDGDEPAWQRIAGPPMDVHGAGDAVVGSGDDERLLVLGGAHWHAEWSIFSWTNRVQVLSEPRSKSP